MSGSLLPVRAPIAAVVGGAAVVALAWTAVLSAKPAPKTTLVSANAQGTGPDNNESDAASISANGRFVAFHSDATDLISPASTPQTNVYVRDLKTKKTRIVSRGPSGNGGNGFSDDASISGNGRFVAFASGATDLLPTADANGSFDVLVADLKKGTTALVSVKSGGGGGGNDDSTAPSINASGRFVAFGSRATDLVAQSAGGSLDDVFVRDLKTGTTTLVSVNLAGTAGGNGDSIFPRISQDGRFVGFTSFAADLAPNDGGGSTRVFLRDLKKGTTALVSVNSAGTGNGNAGSGEPAISAGGRFVAFNSSATDLVTLKTSSLTADVFVRDMKTGTTRLVSVNLAGTDGGNGDSLSPAISADGRYVLFSSHATDLVANGGSGRSQIYVRDLKKGTTTLVSVNQDGTGPASGQSYLDADPCFTPNGKFAAFDSGASDLVTGDGNGQFDVFVRRVR
jgi:hypothetical protein